MNPKLAGPGMKSAFLSKGRSAVNDFWPWLPLLIYGVGTAFVLGMIALYLAKDWPI